MARTRARHGKPKKNRVKNILRRVALVFLGLFFGLNVYLLNAERLAGNQLPMPLGVGAAVVLSGSMEPVLSVDDIVIVTKADGYEIGDVVVFQDGRSLVIHEIIEKEGSVITTKGTANNVADHPIDLSQVKGKMVYKISSAGWVVDMLKSPVGVIVMILLAFLLIEGSFRRQKDDDRQRIMQLKEEIRQLKEGQETPSE